MAAGVDGLFELNGDFRGFPRSGGTGGVRRGSGGLLQPPEPILGLFWWRWDGRWRLRGVRFLGNGALSRWRHHGRRAGGGLDCDFVFVVMVPVVTVHRVILPKAAGLGVVDVEVALFGVGDDFGGFHRFRGVESVRKGSDRLLQLPEPIAVWFCLCCVGGGADGGIRFLGNGAQAGW